MPKLTEVMLRSKKGHAKFLNYFQLPMYKQLRPAVLGPNVASRGEGKQSAHCVQEMSNMLVCLEKSDYNQSLCSKEIKGYDTCTQDYLNERSKRKDLIKQGVVFKDKGRYPVKIVNATLEKFPQPNVK